jgi:hypothetical protein
MLGFRGASRYVSESFRDCFDLEVRALRRVREDMGLENVQVMIPFLRTVGEAEKVTSAAGGDRVEARGEGAEADHDVRASVECTPGRRVSRVLRRLLDRIERPHTADPGARPGFRPDRPPLRGTGPGGSDAPLDGDPGLQEAGKVRGNLWAGPLGSSRSGDAGSWTRGSTAFPSIRTLWSRHGCTSPGRRSTHPARWVDLRDPSV